MKKIYSIITLVCILLLQSNIMNSQTLMPIPPHSVIYSGSVRGYWFIAPTTFTITGLRVASEAGTTGDQSLQVMKIDGNGVPLYTVNPAATNFTTLYYGNSIPNGTIQTVNIPISAGDTIGILGAIGTYTLSYSASATPFASTIAGFPLSLNRFLYQGSISAAPAPNFSSEGANTPIGRVEMYYVTGPCTSPPTAGTSTASITSACLGSNITLNLSGSSFGTGQTYQWQYSTSSTGPWTNLGSSQTTSSYATIATTTLYYRCGVTCTSNTTYSTPVQVVVPAAFPGGTYTINSALPTSGSNFHSFGDAVSAISCGIAGPVIFNVNAASGPYNEQVSIPGTVGSTAVNTVTFNCNNTTINYTNTNTANYAILRLDGAKYITFKKLNVVANSAGTYGYTVLLTNGAKNNLFDSCTIDANMAATTTNFWGVLIGCSSTSYTTSTTACDSNTISNCTIIGGYGGIDAYGTASPLQQYNRIINNTIRDYYVYGNYLYYNNNMLIENNDIHRLNRTTLSTFYGCYMGTGNLNTKISKNKIHNPYTQAPTNTGSAYGVYHGSTATVGNENVISNNTLYNMDGNGAHYVLYTAGAYVRWYYNTISEDYTAATAGLTYVCYIISNYAGVEYKNNNISLTRGGTTTRYCVYRSGTGYPTIQNNNNYYVSGSSNNVGYNGGTVCATLAAWQTASSADANSTTVNPNFVGPTTGDLTPTNLAMDNIGTPITGITTDITGLNRNATTPDAGAFEFNNCNAPASITVSNLKDISATLSWPAVSGSAGYEYVLDQVVGNPAGAGTAITATTYAATGLTANTTYYMHVRNNCGSSSFSGWITQTFKTCAAATITPASTTTFCTGGSVMLNGPTPPTGTTYTYQWQLNGGNITTGGTGASYTATASGNYAVIMTNTTANCSATTVPPTVVTVGAPPSSAISPANTAGLCPGGSTTLTTNAAPGLIYQWYLNGNAITAGGNASTYSATATGNYTVNVSSGPGCNSTTTNATVVSMLTPPPAAITPPPHPVICQSSTLTLSANSGTSYAYQWYFNGSPISPNGTSITYNAANAGSYTVKVTNTSVNCGATSQALALTIVPLPPAITSPSTPSAGCDSLVLTANSGSGYTYKWKQNNVIITGAVNQMYSATSSGSYAAVVTDGNDCSATSANVAITINPSPSSIITYSSPLAFCNGGAVVLNSYISSGLHYQWLKNGSPVAGDTLFSELAAQSGNYSLQVTNSFGCSKVSQPVVVEVYAQPMPAITKNGNVLSTGNYALYQWYMNNQPIPGATGQSYTTTQNGGYNVDVVDMNGCKAISPVVFMNNTSVQNLTASGIRVYPNPTRDIIYIESSVMVNVTVRDMAGRNIIVAPGAKQIDMSKVADGIYMLMITDSEGHFIKNEKLVKAK